MKLSLAEEEKLAYEVKKYRCLFDKSDRGYRERDCTNNAWEEVATCLDFLDSGDTAKLSFEKLRKRYNKKKNDVKKVKKSGTGTRESEKAEKALESYQFLYWLDNFIYIRESRTNIQKAVSSDEEEEELRMEDIEKDDEYSDGDPIDENESISSRATSFASPDQPAVASPAPPTISPKAPLASPVPFSSSVASLTSHITPVQEKAPSKKKSEISTGKRKAEKDLSKKSKVSKSEYLDDMEMNLIRDLGKAVKHEPKDKELDEVDIYVKSLAVDLKKLSARDYIMVKHEIQNIVFRCQMAHFQQQMPHVQAIQVSQTPKMAQAPHVVHTPSRATFVTQGAHTTQTNNETGQANSWYYSRLLNN